MAKARRDPGAGAAARASATPRRRPSRCAPPRCSLTAEGVLDTADIERVHDMRVATRRLRAAMEVFAACFPAKEHSEAAQGGQALADALGERRDPDVAIEELEAIAAELGGARGLRSLIDGAARRAGARRTERWPRRLSASLDERLAERLADAGAGGARVKARKVKGLDPDGTLAENARADRGGAAGGAALLQPGACSTPRRWRRCTTCGSRPSACATCSS